jgi:hypothetical protein
MGKQERQKKQTPYVAKTRDDHLYMMSHPAEWPRWPVLPIKRTDPATGFPQTALMFAVADHLTDVYTGNMYTLKGPRIKDAMDSCELLKTYIDYDGILDDGWVVD